MKWPTRALLEGDDVKPKSWTEQTTGRKKGTAMRGSNETLRQETLQPDTPPRRQAHVFTSTIANAQVGPA